MMQWRVVAVLTVLTPGVSLHAGNTIYRCQKGDTPVFQDFPCNGRPSPRVSGPTSSSGAARAPAVRGSAGDGRCMQALRKLQRQLLQARSADAAMQDAQQGAALTARLREEVEAACR